jgi:hypothetical protein
MRVGNGGADMFRKCLAEGVAAIHYDPIESVDLSKITEENLPAQWDRLEPSQSGSMRKFAWRIRGGDTLYVAESYPSRLIGVGRVRGPAGTLGYRYVERTPIIDSERRPWRHQLAVEWEQHFDPVAYPNPWAAQATVLDLGIVEARKIKALIARNHATRKAAPRGETKEANAIEYQIGLRQLESAAYTRYTQEAIRTIERRHVKLCESFTKWIRAERGLICQIERRNIDVSFSLRKKTYLVEFKIAYSGDPKPAIREALGQILEYNHYPGRTKHDRWILVLDCEPTEADRNYLKSLKRYGLPLSFGWKDGSTFRFTDSGLD